MDILTTDDAREFVATDEPSADVHAQAIADASAAHAQWRDSRPPVETAGLPDSPVVHPPEGDGEPVATEAEPATEPVPAWRRGLAGQDREPVRDLSDDQLRAEAARRGWNIA